MAHRVADRVRETSTAPGTGSFSLNGAVQGAQSFSSFLATGDTTYYVASNGTAWETGFGTFTSPSTLARTAVLSSSNAGAAVNFASGAVDVFCDIPATRLRVKLPGGTVTLIVNFSASAGTALGVPIGGGNDTTGRGTLASPFKSVNNAAYYAYNNYDLNGSTSPTLFVIQMADSVTDTDGLHWSAHAVVGAQGGAAFTIKGGTNSVLAYGQVYFGGNVIRFQDLTLRDGLQVDYGAFVYLSGVTIGTGPATAGISLGAGSSIELYGALSFAGINCFAAILNTGGYFNSAGQTITVTANQTVSGAWIYAQDGGVSNFSGSTLTNAFTVTGTRYVIYDGASVRSGNGSITYFPGTVAGVNNSGYYDTVPGKISATTGISGIVPVGNGGTGTSYGALILASYANSVNFNAVGDTVLTLSLPAGVTKWMPNVLVITNEGTTASLTNAQFGLFTAAGGGGTALIASGTAMSSITSNAAGTATNAIQSGAASALWRNEATLYFRITTAQGAAASGSIYFYIRALP